MVTNSSLYECTVMHNRKEKTANKFYYKYFMFYLDLDEIDILVDKLRLFSRNKFNVFNFRDTDHMVFDKPGVKDNILKYLKDQGVDEEIGKIMLLANVATFGYNFNPVSFYYCFDRQGNPLCVVPEVGNTFGELKAFFINRNNFNGKEFNARLQKNFYVSPFIDHDIYFDFKLSVPGDKLNIKIDDYRGEARIFITRLSGKKEELNDKNLFKYTLKYPLVTLKVIGAIHWQALKLIIKKVPFFRKNEFLELQKGALAKWKT